MKIKKTLAIAACTAVALPAFSQLEGTRVNDRIGHGNDSIESLANLSLFADFYNQKNYAEAYTPWKELMAKAPLAQASVYTRGPIMLNALIKAETDATKKLAYFNDLMALYDQRIKYLSELNSFSSAVMRTSKGSILCRKAYDYCYAGQGVDPNWTLAKALEMFTEGIEMVNNDPEYEVEGFVLHGYFIASYNMYKYDNNFREQFLQDYLLCKEVCEKMLEKANGVEDSVAAKKIVDSYDPVLVQVENAFAESNAADREQLLAIFGPKVEQKKNDLKYLQSAIRILADNDCDDTDVYFNAARYAFALQPTYDSAIGTAQWSMKQGRAAEAIQYYNKAIELSDDNKTKARIAMRVVYALNKAGQSGSVGEYLNKVVAFDSSMKGKADLFRAQQAASQRQYDQAIAYATSAAAADPSVSGTATRLKTRISEAKRRHAEYEKANAEYKAELKKQQDLENFWKGH